MANIIRRGIDAYRQTMNQPPSGEVPDEPEISQGKAAPANKAAKSGHGKNPGKAKLKAPAPMKPAGGEKKGLLKKTILPEEPKVRRVAKFLILIGSDQAAKILGELDGDQVEEISREIATIRGVGPEEAEAILAEFRSMLVAPWKAGFGPSYGGVETARRMLYAVYGPEKGEALLNKSVPESKENIFDFLEEFEAEQLVFLLKDESAAAAALVLARLSPKMSAQTLGKFPPALKPEILKRIAHQSEVAPEVLEQVAAALREKARFLGGGGSKDIPIDGMQTLAAILKQSDYSFGNRLINELGSESPEIEKNLKDRLYTLDDVLAAYDRPLAEKIKTMTDKDVAMLLKGRSVEFREKILSNVSTGRRSVIREEYDVLGEVPRRECDEAANNFLAWFRQARERGEIMLIGDEEWVV